MSLLSASLPLLFIAQGVVPAEIQSMDILFDEIADEAPVNAALLIGGTELCGATLLSKGEAAPLGDWIVVENDDDASILRMGGVLVAYIKEDKETSPGCMVLAKPRITRAVLEAALAKHLRTSGRPSRTDGDVSIPGTTFTTKRFDYLIIGLDDGNLSTPSNKGGLIIGVKFKEES